MPFTGTGTGIQNANDIFFSGLSSNHVLRYNNGTAKWNNVPLAVSNAELTDNTITEAKLSVANIPSTNHLLSWDGSGLIWVANTKATVGLANVDNTSDLNKPVSTATQSALDAKANDSAVVHDTGAETIAGIKTFSSSPVVPTPTTSTQAANKSYVDSNSGSGEPNSPVFTRNGTLIIVTGSLPWYNDSGRTLTINKVRASVGSAPTGSAVIIDINKNGSTIFTNQSNRTQIAASALTGTSVPDVTTIADGDYLTADVDQVGSGNAGSNLLIQLTLA